MTEPLIVGAGSPLVDLLVEEKDDFVQRLGSEKGGMIFVESDVIEKAVESTDSPVSYVPGGSTCNTLVGIGRLGARARMVGRLGQDALAGKFKEGLRQSGVESGITESSGPTGRVLSVVTPDAERTMFTALGVAADFHPDDIVETHFEAATHVHLEGYQLFNRPVVDRVVAAVERSGATFSLDLASFQVVEACRDYLEELIPASVDILLANEEEARAYTGKNEAEALEELARVVDIAVVKIGERGVLLARGDQRAHVKAIRVDAVDTTGAGDLWAAGFLYGLSHGYGLDVSGWLGCVVASEVVQVIGAKVPDDGWERILKFRDTLLRGC